MDLNAPQVRRAIFNEMRPVKRIDGKCTGMNFELDVPDNADGEWSYKENGTDICITFSHKEMKWNTGKMIKMGAGKAQTVEKEYGVKYNGSLRAGINTEIIIDNYRFQKIIEIESLESLGDIPNDAEYLEISFDISGNVELPNGEITKRIKFGDDSSLLPVRAWDSSEPPENPEDEIDSGATGNIIGNVLTKRIPVTWLKNASYPLRTDVSIVYGDENTFNSANTYDITVAMLDSTHFVVVYRDYGGDDYGIARVGVVSGTTITSYGDENIFNAASTNRIAVGALDSTHFVVAYRDEGGDDYGIARVGVVSGTTITSYGDENIFNAASTYYICLAVLDNSHFVVIYSDSGNFNYGTARVGVVSGTTITSYGDENIFYEGTTYDTDCAALDSTHFVIIYKDVSDSYDGQSKIGLTDGGATISSFGAQKTFNAANYWMPSVAALDNTHFVVAYRDEGGDGYGIARVGVVSGTTITSYGPENVFNATYTRNTSVAKIDSTHFVVAYKDDGGDGYGITRIGVVSGTTITSYGPENIFNTAITDSISVAALDSTHIIVTYRDDGGDNYGIARVGEVSYGWTGIILEITNPTHINGISVADITKVNDV